MSASSVVSILALMVGAAALGWNVVNYLLTGQRARVTVQGMRVMPIPGMKQQEPIAQITVRAVGRVPVEVTGWSVTYPGEQHLLSAIVAMQYGKAHHVYMGDPLPKVIDPGRHGAFNIPIAAITGARDHLDLDPAHAYVSVHFAARRSIKVKESIGALLRLPTRVASDSEMESESEREAPEDSR